MERSEERKPLIADDEMIKSRSETIDYEEKMYTNMGLDAPVHISWERCLIARIEHLKQQLDHQVNRLATARENMSLRNCKKCSHLHMDIHICYMCGYDDSIEDDAE